MNSRMNPMTWSFGLGTWFHTRIRVHVMMVLVLLWAWSQFDLRLGTAFFCILFASVLLHEFGHIVAARVLGAGGDEILLWPFGGLAYVGAGSGPRSQILISAAGPFVNLLICLATLYPVLHQANAAAGFNPLMMPVANADFGKNLLVDVALVIFTINWASLLLNLIPATPLDGGQMLRNALVIKFGPQQGLEYSIRASMGVSIVMGIVAVLVLNNIFLLSMAFVLTLLAIQESQQLQMAEAGDDSFMGYDFSQGYTSLEQSDRKTAEPARKPGMLERWKQNREAARVQRESDARQAAEEQLDNILAKIQEHGMDSLTAGERHQLKLASERRKNQKGL